jgi:Family of unknown function (DUF5906)
VDDADFTLDIPEEEKPAVMEQRKYSTIAWRQLGSSVHYCLPRSDKPVPGEDNDDGEQLHVTDPDLVIWREDVRKQKLNAALFLQQGVVEVTFFGPDQTLNQCFFAACAKLGLSARFAFGRRSRPIASSVLFKLRDDEAKRLDEEYSGFRPRFFSVDDARRGVVIRYAAPAKRASQGQPATTLLPGSLLWSADGVRYDLIDWRDEAGQGPSKPRQTAAPLVEYFTIVRAAAYASILNIIPGKAWDDYAVRRVVCEWLARLTRDGQAINSNAVFAKASRAIVSEPAQGELIIDLLCSRTGQAVGLEECLGFFRFGRKRLEADPSRIDVAGWSGLARALGEEAQKALRAVLNVGADSTLLEDYADRYLFHSGHSEFIDRQAFHEGQDHFIFAKDSLALRHAPDQIQTKKKPLEAFPIFVKSKLRQDVTDVETYPDHPPGSIIRVTREGAIIADNDYAPDHSRLIFNDWRGLYIHPAKTIEAALKAECEDKLDHMLSLVTNRHAGRAQWIKAHFGWTLKYPGQKQQVALICTGDQGTGKSFLCTTFAQAIFGRYADTASVRALDGQFYIAGYIGKLWVSHDEFVSNFDNAEILKTLIRGTRVSGEIKGRDTATYAVFARLAFTSNEANPGISRGREERGVFQVTSITATSEGLLPGEFRTRMLHEVAPFYESYSLFLERPEVRRAYARILIDCAPAKINQVEDLAYSAMRDEEVSRAHLTQGQLVAKIILESGTVHRGYDIAMPFRDEDIFGRVQRLTKEMGIRGLRSSDVLQEFFNAGILGRMDDGAYLFKWKIGGLHRLYSAYVGVPLHAQWSLGPNDDMFNDYRAGDAMEMWKGRPRDDEQRNRRWDND